MDSRIVIIMIKTILTVIIIIVVNTIRVKSLQFVGSSLNIFTNNRNKIFSQMNDT